MFKRFVQFGKLWIVLAVAVSSLGCSQNDPLCPNVVGAHPIAFYGNMTGQGTLSFASMQDAQHYQIDLQLFDPFASNKTITMKISGLASCENGVITGELHGGAENAQYKVLGGSLSAVFNKKTSIPPYGRWVVSIVDKNISEDQKINGYFTVLDDSSDASHESTEKNTIKEVKDRLAVLKQQHNKKE